MSVQIHCSCGWTSQVSEFYLGDRVSCPDCGRKLNVHPQAGVPYGYPPYTTWQNPAARPNVRRPLPRRAPVAPDNPHSAAAFVLGLMAMLLAFTGCGTPLAVCGVISAARSRAWSLNQGRPVDGNTKLGFGFTLVAVAISVLLFASVLNDGHRTRCRGPAQEQPVKLQPAGAPQTYRYAPSDARMRELRERTDRYFAEREAWERAAREQGFRYPVEPTPTPVKPRGEFQEFQERYSRKVSEQRAQSPSPQPVIPQPGNGYGN